MRFAIGCCTDLGFEHLTLDAHLHSSRNASQKYDVCVILQRATVLKAPQGCETQCRTRCFAPLAAVFNRCIYEYGAHAKRQLDPNRWPPIPSSKARAICVQANERRSPSCSRSPALLAGSDLARADRIATARD